MRLSRLRLNGFKSFVDPTDLMIHDGLTGVVGPNGCGKSNLLEALRWVMGESRASAVRGAGMEDVIFAGSASRPARATAEVALMVENADRRAPPAFNGADRIEVVRRIARDAGSAFRVNGAEVRARDVQMLFADASTGAYSPALVRQGQIAELINAKPKARRRVLEEAAGISGLYARRHEAELRLAATEANLARLRDVVEALSAQIASLARQARAAQRYREIGADLRSAEAALLALRWREAESAANAAEAGARAHLVGVAAAEAAILRAAAAREAAEAALPPLREEAGVAAALTARLQPERQGLDAARVRARTEIEGFEARTAQLAQDAAREAGLNRDAGETIARLEAEASRLAAAGEGQAERLSRAQAVASEAAARLRDVETVLSHVTEDAARLSARHLSAERLSLDAAKALERAQAEAARAATTGTDAAALLRDAATAFDAAADAEREALAAAEAADAALQRTEQALAALKDREAQARTARMTAEGEAQALRAEVAALDRLVARETGAGGHILDRLTVAEGYEAALGAALGDDLLVPEASGDGSGWGALPDYADAPPLPDGAMPFAPHVEAPPVLVRRLAQTGLVARGDGAAMQAGLRPGQRLVSREGDLWRWDGFRARAEDAPKAAALRLRQMNRLVQVRRDLEEAQATAEGAQLEHAALRAELAALAEADGQARGSRRDADARVTAAARAAARADADRALAEGRRAAADIARARHGEEAADAARRLAEARVALVALPDLEAAAGMVHAARHAVEKARADMLTSRAAHDDLRREGEARLRRAEGVVRDLAAWRARLDTAERREADLSARRAAAEAGLAAARAAPGDLDRRQAALDEAARAADLRRAAADRALETAEAALRDARAAEREADRTGSQVREVLAADAARAEAALAAVLAAEGRLTATTGVDPATLIAGLATGWDAASGDQREIEIARLKRQREALGAVNLRAEADSAAVTGEHDLLARESADLEEAVKKLRSGIAGLNREGRERLLTAFEQVNGNFAVLFTHLFGGGEARLVLVESDDPLEAGLEILCQPPGKKLSSLSLLSGGEQTLTALALIFGVFLANPAPICVLDEVDAPLDDANVTRFCDLLDEMTRRTETRFLVITHHAVTMARMDRLFGVTMAEQGVSQLVSVDLKRAAVLVA